MDLCILPRDLLDQFHELASREALFEPDYYVEEHRHPLFECTPVKPPLDSLGGVAEARPSRVLRRLAASVGGSCCGCGGRARRGGAARLVLCRDHLECSRRSIGAGGECLAEDAVSALRSSLRVPAPAEGDHPARRVGRGMATGLHREKSMVIRNPLVAEYASPATDSAPRCEGSRSDRRLLPNLALAGEPR